MKITQGTIYNIGIIYMPGRRGSRIMGAGLAGHTSYANVNQYQIGDKLQGGAPLGTGYFKAKHVGQSYRTRADGNNTQVIFCMNRMGGVGKGKSQFKTAGVAMTDGTKPCSTMKPQKP